MVDHSASGNATAVPAIEARIAIRRVSRNARRDRGENISEKIMSGIAAATALRAGRFTDNRHVHGCQISPLQWRWMMPRSENISRITRSGSKPVPKRQSRAVTRVRPTITTAVMTPNVLGGGGGAARASVRSPCGHRPGSVPCAPTSAGRRAASSRGQRGGVAGAQ